MKYKQECDEDGEENEALKVLFWKSLEHHRYLAFQTILCSSAKLSNQQLEQYIELCQLDEDETMALSALINLVSWQGLRAEQFNKLIEHPAFSHPIAQKEIWRTQMYAELLSDSIPGEVFSKMLARQDFVFERWLNQTAFHGNSWKC